MKRSLAILGCVLAGALHAATIPAPSTSGTLRWMNGDLMTGDLVAATGATASWQSPLFVQPVTVSWDALHRADWPEAAAAASGGDPFMFRMRDGSTIMGDLVSVSGSTVTVKGSRCGVAEIARAQLLCALRLNGNDLVFNGPAGMAGWKPFQQNGSGDNGSNGDIQPGGAPLAELEGGALSIPYWNRGAQLSVNLPDAMDIEFHIHSSDTPDFRLTLGNSPGTDMAIQTWGDEIVVASGADFKFVAPINGDHAVALRLCWDRAKRHCEVFTPEGRQLLDWTLSGADTTGTGGLLLQNKGPDLVLDSLRVRKWNDGPPSPLDETKPRLEMADGRVLQGAVTETGSNGALLLSGSAVPLKDVDAIVFSADASGAGSATEMLTWSDGTYLKGRILDAAQGVAMVQTAFSTAPLAMRMAGLRELMIPTTASVPDSPILMAGDSLKVGETLLHGTLVGGDDASPHWLPAGGAVPVTPSPAMPYEIVRALPDDSPVTGAPALFYTHMGDVLPGNMHSLDRTGVEFDSGITQATRLPGAALEAIQFGAAAAARVDGFSNPGWLVLKGGEAAARRSGNSIDMDPGSSIGNASAMQSSEIRFHMKTGSGLAAVRLRLFCEGTDPAKSHNLLFASNGMTLMCGSEATEGQFDEPRIDAQPPGGDVEVRLEILDESVNVYLNGVCAMKLPISAGTRAGAGLIIEPASVWGNAGQTISLIDFSMAARPGATWLPDVAPDAKAQALSIPRFRRDDPPLHALIAANGDILRGEIEAATATSFGFRCGMEELVVPRDRVKAVIWLAKPVDTQPAAAPARPVDAILDQKTTTMIGFSEANLQSITRWIHATYPGLNFRLPKNQMSRRVAMVRLGGGTVREMLDKVCAQYGMKYTVNDAGEIVIEPDTGSGGGALQMVEKVYWLKLGSLPPGEPAARTLAAEGIDFPPGATAEWQPAEGQLTVLNTPANQAKLAQTLAGDFVSGIGSPTHWLVLTSGARLGLAVDKFGKDAITGWHPLYGRCTIRTRDVAMVRTYPLTPSAAMKSLQGWQPYFAPEPVLPTAGGDSDASIGKPAAPFKLKLLGGGQFDLAKARGKIVVLDFWATWCGPCVRSLPGLIDSMAGFPPDRVTFLGVNQDEPAATVRQFLETRGWKLTVALDDGATVGNQYGADSIPHTVIIGPDGKIAWVKTGYTPDGEGDAAKEVTQLLAPAPATR